MTGEASGEVLFTVDGDQATLAKQVRIEELGLTEPYHLEKWVTSFPSSLGDGVLIVASQYDKWLSPSGAEPRDRLDLLGLGADGRLVVAELKRGKAPDTVELQAIKYAAMSSRFTVEHLASLHADFLERTEDLKLTSEEAIERLQAHAPDVNLSPEVFRKPRIVLLAESYPDSVTTAVVWLAEQGVDMTLRRYQAYTTAGGETILTVSQMYPVADIAAFLVGPRQGPSTSHRSDDLPTVPWTTDDFAILIGHGFPVPEALVAACSESPGTWVSSATIYERANVEPPSGRGKVAGFGYSVQTRFGRRNPPWEVKWGAGGANLSYYRVDEQTALAWHDARSAVAAAVAEDGSPDDEVESTTSRDTRL